MSVSGIPIAQLVVFIILLHPALYILWSHGKHGILGWICIQSFCLVRIVGSILQIIQERDNTTPTLATFVLISIGLTPLLLACLEILHEARRARNPNLRNGCEWFLVIQYHSVISVAMALILVGIVRLQNGTDPSPSNSIFMKIGFAVLLICWILLLGWVLVSLPQKHLDTTIYADGTKLLYAVLVAMPFLIVRLIYGVCFYFVTDVSFTNSVAAKVVLSVVPEMVAVLVLEYVGMNTVNMWRNKRDPNEF